MKNIPHQINDLEKLYRALATFADLEERDLNLLDDSVVGGEMARRRIRTFRGDPADIEEALRLEAEKPRSDQGSLTFARDLRRFFLLLGFLEADLRGVVKVSARGRHLLAVPRDSQSATDIWKAALREMAVSDALGTSRPYAIMLRLVQARPNLPSPKLALALEAHDDSPEEFQRILALADAPDWLDQMEGATEAKVANATKILPGIARQLGDIVEEAGGNRLTGTPPADPAPTREGTGGRGNRRVSANTVAQAPRGSDAAPDTESYADPAQTAELRFQRLTRHNALVRRFAALAEAAGYELREDPYDLLAHKEGTHSLLVEGKTLAESQEDEVARIRTALGQLLYYDWFSVPAELKSDGLQHVALLERKPSNEHIDFLEAKGVAVVWADGDAWGASEWTRGRIAFLQE